jgi:hypothetical protein
MVRMKHTVAILGGIVVVWIACAALAIGLMFMNMIFYAGNTGSEHHGVHAFLTHLYNFGVGAIFGAGTVALANAIVRPRPFWLIPILAGAVLGGALFLAKPAIPERIDAGVAPLVRAAYERGRGREPSEKDAVLAFVRAQKATTDAVGSDYKAYITSELSMQGSPVRYMISLVGPVTAHAIVVVDQRPSSGAVFRLACVLPPDTPSVDIRRCQ